MPVWVNRTPASSSQTRFQQELRDWYAEKSRLEYRSDAYARLLDEERNRGRFDVEEAQLKTLCAESRSRLQQRLHQQRADIQSRVEQRSIQAKGRERASNVPTLESLLCGTTRRYEATPDLSLEEILYGVSALSFDERGLSSQSTATTPVQVSVNF